MYTYIYIYRERERERKIYFERACTRRSAAFVSRGRLLLSCKHNSMTCKHY